MTNSTNTPQSGQFLRDLADLIEQGSVSVSVSKFNLEGAPLGKSREFKLIVTGEFLPEYSWNPFGGPRIEKAT
jgi:hypothetical protein